MNAEEVQFLQQLMAARCCSVHGSDCHLSRHGGASYCVGEAVARQLPDEGGFQSIAIGWNGR